MMGSRTTPAAIAAIALLGTGAAYRRGFRVDVARGGKCARVGDLLVTWKSRAVSPAHPLIDGASATFVRTEVKEMDRVDGVPLHEDIEVERWSAGGAAVRMSWSRYEIGGRPIPLVFVGLRGRRGFNPYVSRLTRAGRARRRELAAGPHRVIEGAFQSPAA